MKTLKRFFYKNLTAWTIDSLSGKNEPLPITNRLASMCVISFPIFFIVGVLLSIFIGFGQEIIVIPCVCLIIILISSNFLEVKRRDIESGFSSLFLKYLIYNYSFDDYNNYTKLINIAQQGYFRKFMKCIKKAGTTFYSQKDISNFNFSGKNFTTSKKYINFKSELDSFWDNFYKKKYQEAFKDFIPKKENTFYKALNYFDLQEKNLSKVQLRNAFVFKAKKLHPDAGGSDEAFREAKDFYDYLSKKIS